MDTLTHFADSGRAHMVDVSSKDVTLRVAVAEAKVIVSEATYALIDGGQIEKGDVYAVAQVAGIMAAKRTSALIPMCHPIAITGADIEFEAPYADEAASQAATGVTIRITATVRCKGETGVEMEALTAASVAALTIYDMCKAVQRDIEITDLRLLEKSGGKSGLFRREI